MRLKPLLEDVEHDQQSRGEANEFYRNLIKAIDEEEAIYQNAGSVDSGKLKGTIAFKGSVLSPKYNKKLVIALAPERLAPKGNKPQKDKMGGSFGPSKDGKFVWLVLPVLRQEYNLEGALEIATSIKETIVHEFIHYLDSERFGGGPEAYTSYAHKERDKGEFGTAASDPHEFNAYYQSSVNRYADELQKAQRQGSHKVDTLLPNSAQEFVKMMKSKFFRKEVLGDLDSQFQRKLDKRLANLHQHLKSSQN